MVTLFNTISVLMRNALHYSLEKNCMKGAVVSPHLGILSGQIQKRL